MNMLIAIIRALERILENQITLKEHLGIIKERNPWDDEYDTDIRSIEKLERAIDDYAR